MKILQRFAPLFAVAQHFKLVTIAPSAPAVNSVVMIPLPSRFVFAAETATAACFGVFAKIGSLLTAMMRLLSLQG
jgi:hypothetical protein